jgi:ABC-type uncharacterized transport system fused permease/ATPase subunit
VLSTVTVILDKCGAVRFDPSADTSEAVAAVDKEIRLFNEYGPRTRSLRPVLSRASTMREVLEGTRNDLNDCSPNDVARVSEALTSK